MDPSGFVIVVVVVVFVSVVGLGCRLAWSRFPLGLSHLGFTTTSVGAHL